MNWFKRREERKLSPELGVQFPVEIDPATKLEVFQNHWKQAWSVMCCEDTKMVTAGGQATLDGLEVVLHNLEQMVTLLVEEVSDRTLPGCILQFVQQSEIMEKFCSWCTINAEVHTRLRLHQLHLLEFLVSRAKQPLLIQKPVFKPLLRVLIDVADSKETLSEELEFQFVLLLHQICICIFEQKPVLENFFSTDADHGPSRFLIFSFLIHYTHREGPIGHKARDALLLIVTLSARHPYIGQYIANNSDFCPVLATCLSGLYSSLPRRVTPPSSDWFTVTPEDCQKTPELQMFVNSLQFCNAVVQVAAPCVRDQIIEFIYTGFLLPVVAPALHQISREEVMTATAYLDLFVRHITDARLLKAVLKFILSERYDDIVIIDSLLPRISSNSQLSLVTLALFHTLLSLNCEDVMFQLVFRYLVPCTHVMVSQRRSVRDLDMYGKSAEKLLSLRPVCCIQDISQNPSPISSPAPPTHTVPTKASNPFKRLSVRGLSSITSSAPSAVTVTLPAVPSTDQGETSYFEYLHDANTKLERTARACGRWTYLYDGESPEPDSLVSRQKTTHSSDVVNSQSSLSSDLVNKKNNREENIELHNSDQQQKNDKCFKETQLNSVRQKSDSLAAVKAACVSRDRNIMPEAGDWNCVDDPLWASIDDSDKFLEFLRDSEQLGQSDDCHNNQVLSTEFLSVFDNFLKSVIKTHKIGSTDMTPAQDEDLPLDDKINSSYCEGKSVEQLCHQSSNSGGICSSPGLANSKILALQSEDSIEIHKTAEVSTNKHKRNKTVLRDRMSKSSYASIAERKRPLSSPTLKSSADLENLSRFRPVELITSSTTHDDLILSHESFNTAKHKITRYSASGKAMSLPRLLTLSSPDELPVSSSVVTAFKKLNYINDPPNVGPFLTALFARLEGMLGNTLYFNLLLTDVLSRLAAYPHPLLRSFLFSHNLVFQPSVKSLFQVLSCLRQKLDSFSLTIKHFDNLVVAARQNLFLREQMLQQPRPSLGLAGAQDHTGSWTSSQTVTADKKKVSFGDLFRRSPSITKKSSDKRRNMAQLSASQLAEVGGDYHSSLTGSLLTGRSLDNLDLHTLSTWNAVYCALVLDDFLKELAALSQEHSVLFLHKG